MGLGATLLQEGQPVAYASHLLPETEQRYAEIEKELLAVVFMFERHDQYLHGRRVHSDHRPLQSIAAKPITAAPKHLQRVLLRLQRYDFTIVYCPGKEMSNANTLSHVCSSNQKKGLESSGDSYGDVACITAAQEFELVNTTENVELSRVQVDWLRTETAKDATLCSLKTVIQQGLPDKKQKVLVTVRP